MKLLYPAIFYPCEAKEGYTVVVPDLPGFWMIPCLNAAAQRKWNFLRIPTIMLSIAFVSAFVC